MNKKKRSLTLEQLLYTLDNGPVHRAIADDISKDTDLPGYVEKVTGKLPEEIKEISLLLIRKAINRAFLTRNMRNNERRHAKGQLEKIEKKCQDLEDLIHEAREQQYIRRKYQPDYRPTEEEARWLKEWGLLTVRTPSGFEFTVPGQNRTLLQDVEPMWAIETLLHDVGRSARLQLENFAEDFKPYNQKTRLDLEVISLSIYLLWKNFGGEACRFPGGIEGAPVNLYHRMCALAKIPEDDFGDAKYHLREAKEVGLQTKWALDLSKKSHSA